MVTTSLPGKTRKSFNEPVYNNHSTSHNTKQTQNTENYLTAEAHKHKKPAGTPQSSYFGGGASTSCFAAVLMSGKAEGPNYEAH